MRAGIGIASPVEDEEISSDYLVAEYFVRTSPEQAISPVVEVRVLNAKSHARLHDEYSLCVSKENSLLYITYMGWLQFFKLVVGICTVQMYVDGQPAGRHNPVICACAKDGTCGMSACKQHFRSPHLPEGLCKRRLARPLITHCLHLAGRDSSVA